MIDVAPKWFSILLFLAGVQPGALPTGLPPLPEDKALVSAAPEECLLYLSWYGRAEAKSTSKNQVEQLLAEPEVQHFYGTVWKELQAAMGRDGFRIGGRAALLSETVLPLAEIVATRPTSLFVSNLQISGRSDMPRNDTQAGLIVNAGQRAKDLQAILARLEGLLVERSGGETKEVTVGGVKLHQLPLPGGAPQVAWGFRSEYLVIAVGEGTAEKIIGRLKDARGPPAWLKRIHERLPIERPAAVTYVNIKGAVQLVSKNLGGGDEESRKLASILKVTGLDNVESLASVTGLDETELVTKTLLATDGEPRGLLNLVSDKPLTAADLASVPRDATFAVATRLDLAKAYKLAFDMIGELDPRAAAAAKEGLAEAEKELEFRVLEDLLEPLGDVGTLYSSPGEGGMLPGVTAVFGVKQAEKLAKVQESLLRRIRTVGDVEHGPSVESFKFLGKTVYVLDVGRGIPLAPSWCLTDKQLIVALYPQSIKALLGRTPARGSLADVPAVAAALKEGPVALGYQDTPELFRTFYPFLQSFAPMAAHELNRADMRVDASLLPAAGTIYPHLRPSVQVLARRDSGIVSISRQTVPAAGGLALAPVVGGAAAFWGWRSSPIERDVEPAKRAEPPAAKEKKTEEFKKAFGDSAPMAGDKEHTLLVSSTRTGNAEIFLVNPEWGDARNLTRHKAEDTFPAWSPDGKKIAFISNRDGGTPNVHVMDADGTHVKQLTTEKGEITFCSCPNWSPDGKKIALCRIRDGTKVDTVVMDADGSNAKSIRENALDAAWSPDGKKFACTIWNGKGFKVCVMDADGTNLKEFATNDNTLGNVYPCWSPDGKKIAYTDLVDGGQEIHVCDADGTNISKLSGLGNSNMAAAWSPDGKTIAFQHSDGTGPVSLYLMDADGANAREVASCKDPSTPVRGNRPAWRPK